VSDDDVLFTPVDVEPTVGSNPRVITVVGGLLGVAVMVAGVAIAVVAIGAEAGQVVVEVVKFFQGQ
jgi:hypothetical protein